jgi:hypothetical protein
MISNFVFLWIKNFVDYSKKIKMTTCATCATKNFVRTLKTIHHEVVIQLVTRNEAIPITQPTSWQQIITPIVPGHTNNVSFLSYPMWYNVIPPYLFSDSNLYPRYFNGMKMFELVNHRITIISMAWYPYPRPHQLVITTSNTPYSTSAQVTIPIQPNLYQPKPSIITQNRAHVQQNVLITLNATTLKNIIKMQLVGGVH